MYKQLTGRRESLDRICGIIRSRASQAVFLMAGPGFGKSTLTDAVSERLSAEMIVLRIHGSSSLATVPYGVLAPYTSALSAEDSVSPVAVLRSVWTYFQQLKSGKDAPLLLVVDDAHHLDESTANIVVDMISAGWASVLATGRPRPGLPQALSQLWYDGLAERIDLRPLTHDQVAEAVSRALEGIVPESTVQCLWSESGGNPLLLDCLLSDAIDNGSLVERNGIWLLIGPWPAVGPKLSDVVSKQLLRTSPEEQDALKLIALSEPVHRNLVEELCGAGVVRSLLDHQLIRESSGGSSDLRLWYPTYGAAVRRMVSASRSLHLRQQLLEHIGSQPRTPEGLLRMVSWSLECGVEVEDARLLEASAMASKMFQNSLALNAASRIRDPELQHRGRMVMARAHYNQGNYDEAARLLDLNFAADRQPAEKAGDVLLWAFTRSALGHSPQRLLDDGGKLFEFRGQVVNDGGRSEAYDAGLRHGAILELYALSLAADYKSLKKSLDEFAAIVPGHDEDDDSAAAQAFVLSMRSEVLRAEGHSVAAEGTTAEAMSRLPAESGEIFFFKEFVLHRQLGAALACGHWAAVDEGLAKYIDSTGHGLVAFGGSVQSWRGLSLLLQGRLDAGCRVLLPAVEALRENDPQRLLPLTLAMAGYAAARTGEAAHARRLLQDLSNIDIPGTGFDADYASIFAAAASDVLDAGGAGLSRLLSLLSDPSVISSAGAELLALALCVELGHNGEVPRMATLTEKMEGAWAAVWHGYARAYISGQPNAYLEAAEVMHDSGMVRAARDSFAAAAELFGVAGDRLRSRQAASKRDHCERELRSYTEIADSPELFAGVQLTRREKDIVVLAVEGLTDRQIADKLIVSVRTVEGHLYRSYAKLGVRSRDQLSAAIQF